ncbi:MAG: DMT family transporter [Clostridia bacterium]|nr:DMT family transporter [Clostridia bacterium]
MMGTVFSVIAGAAMSVQGVFNTAVSGTAGLYEANTFIQGTAFLLSLVLGLFLGDGSYNKLFSVNKIYLTGGILGVLITVFVMLAIKHKGATVAVSVILVSQLLTAALIDAFGLFETQKIAFGLYKYLGLLLMIAGVIIFKKEI